MIERAMILISSLDSLMRSEIFIPLVILTLSINTNQYSVSFNSAATLPLKLLIS